MRRDYLRGAGIELRASVGAVRRAGGTSRGSKHRQLGGYAGPFARPDYGAVSGGPSSGLVPRWSGGPAHPGGQYLLCVPRRVHDLLPNGVYRGRPPSRICVAEAGVGRDDRNLRKRSDASGRQRTGRHRDAAADKYQTAKYGQVTVQLDQVGTARWLHQYESHGSRSNCVRRLNQAGLDDTPQLHAGINGVVRSGLGRLQGLAGVEIDGERLARQLKDVPATDRIRPEPARSLISDYRGRARCKRVLRGGQTRYYRCRYRDRPHLYNHFVFLSLFEPANVRCLNRF